MAAERADGETKPEGHRRNENEKSSLRLCRREKKTKRPTRTVGSINLIECSWIMGETVKNNSAAKEDSKIARLSLFNLDPAAESERGV